MIRIHHCTKYAALRVEEILITTETVDYSMNPGARQYRPPRTARMIQAAIPDNDRGDESNGKLKRR